MNEILDELFRLGKKAADENEIPIAAAVVRDGKIISSAYNQTEREGNFLAHAEMIALKSASEKLQNKYLNGCELYVSLEPCQMCLTAAKLCRISSVHYVLKSEKFGQEGQAYWKLESKIIDTHEYSSKFLELLQSFFHRKR